MKNFRAGTFSSVSQDKIEKNILVEGKHPSILILRQRRQNSIFFDSHLAALCGCCIRLGRIE
jgi:hypothetical protein